MRIQTNDIQEDRPAWESPHNSPKENMHLAQTEFWAEAARSVDELTQLFRALRRKTDRESSMHELNAAEALYGFAAWLTTRDTAVTFSAEHDAALAADLVNAFVGANGLERPRDGWEKQLNHPKP